jgi:hypothetical protein
MNQQTPDQGRQELKAIIVGIFNHVHRKEQENAILSASRMEAKIEQFCIPSIDRQSQENGKDRATI